MGSGTPAVRCGAAGSGTLSVHCHTAREQCTMRLLHRVATLFGSSWRCNSCRALGGSSQWDSFSVPPHCWGALGSRTPSPHCHTAWDQLAMRLLLRTATLLGSNGQWDSFSALRHCWGAAGNGTPSVQCHTTCHTTVHSGAAHSGTPSLQCHTFGEQWAVGLLHCVATPLGSNG